MVGSRGISRLESVLAIGILLLVVGCVRGEIDRPGSGPTPALRPTATATAEIASPAPLPTPKATVTSAAVVTTSTPDPTPTVTPSATPAAEPTASATPPPTPTMAPEPTPTTRPEPTATPSAGDTPSPTPVPVVLEVGGPPDGAQILYDAVVVFGFASAGASVTVNEVIVVVDEEGKFQVEVSLVSGENDIEVVASHHTFGPKTRQFRVTSLALLPLPHFLVVTEPVDQSIVSENPMRVSGRTTPDAIVSVNGVSIPVDYLGIFSTAVTLEEGPNIIGVLATDPKGAALSTVLAVIYRP